MKKLYTFLVGATVCASSMAQLVIDEDFNVAGAVPAEFTAIDEDALPPNNPGFENWLVDTVQAGPYAGVPMAMSQSWLEGFAPGNSNWLISPAIEVSGSDFTFAWAACPGQGHLYMDGYRVVLSTTDGEIASFTEELAVYAENINDDATMFSDGIVHETFQGDTSDTNAPAQGIMVHRELDLSAYDGQTVYVAIHHNSNDDFFMYLDYIKAGSAALITQVDEATGQTFDVNVFPNPSSDYVNFDIASNQATTAKIQIVNQMGQIVHEDEVNVEAGANVTVDVREYNAGVYFSRINFGRNIVEKAFVVK